MIIYYKTRPATTAERARAPRRHISRDLLRARLPTSVARPSSLVDPPAPLTHPVGRVRGRARTIFARQVYRARRRGERGARKFDRFEARTVHTPRALRANISNRNTDLLPRFLRTNYYCAAEQAHICNRKVL